jgi:glycosyltransferase involved in cell wall biosynthesis
MPIYNGIEYISDSVSSVIDQSYSEWELNILINGHFDDDNVYKKANEYSNDKIKVYNLYDIKGKSNALNRGLSLCSYDNICLIDVDDLWLPDKLLKQSELINKYDVIGTYCRYFGDSDGFPDIPLGKIHKQTFRYVNPIINSSSCFKKDDAHWESEWESVEDYCMWLRLNKLNRKFYNIPEILTMHRIHGDSFFNTNEKQKILRTELLKKYYP